MVVVIRNGDLEVEICAEGDYAPDVMADLCNRAKELYLYQVATLQAVIEDDE